MTVSASFRSGVPLLVAAVTFAAGVLVGSVTRGPDVPRVLAATAAADESFAACTAPIEDGTEGLFLLDFETGDLTGGVLTRNAAKFTATFRYDGAKLFKDLDFKPGKAKNPRFLLTTGLADFAGNAGTNMARSVLYVTDASTGVSVAYAIPWNSQQAAAGAPVTAQFVPLDRAAPRGGKAK